MLEFIDQMQRKIRLEAYPPKRIISLVPSQTELLADLGLDEEVIGITKFCVHPPDWFRTKTKIGGTKDLKLEKIAALGPDLIIGNKEENTQSNIEWLAARFPVWMSDIYTLDGALSMVEMLGQIVGKADSALALRERISHSFAGLGAMSSAPRVAYLIWQNPLMVAASGTFIDDLLQRAGFVNAFADQVRYPVLTEEQLVAAAPDLIWLSSEPYPFKDKHLTGFEKLCPNAQVALVDGELFSWYGSRLLRSAAYFQQLRQPFVAPI
jgi:ABC-type Fe3+-hydroxamate transport system substrate-binding protein